MPFKWFPSFEVAPQSLPKDYLDVPFGLQLLRSSYRDVFSTFKTNGSLIALNFGDTILLTRLFLYWVLEIKVWFLGRGGAFTGRDRLAFARSAGRAL